MRSDTRSAWAAASSKGPDVANWAGAALLPGLLVCGACGRRMHAGYRTKAKPYYECMRRKLEGSSCCGLGAAALDAVVGQQILRALAPAALELSLKALENIHEERE